LTLLANLESILAVKEILLSRPQEFQTLCKFVRAVPLPWQFDQTETFMAAARILRVNLVTGRPASAEHLLLRSEYQIS
jgi:hypothetical protein